MSWKTWVYKKENHFSSQEPIEKLHQRVQDMDEIRTEKLNRVKLVEKEKVELEKPKNEAMDFLHLANEIVHKQVGWHCIAHALWT